VKLIPYGKITNGNDVASNANNKRLARLNVVYWPDLNSGGGKFAHIQLVTLNKNNIPATFEML
jgi:hypothetical protein